MEDPKFPNYQNVIVSRELTGRKDRQGFITGKYFEINYSVKCGKGMLLCIACTAVSRPAIT